MLSILIVCLFLGANVHSAPPSSSFDVDEELTKISTSCLTFKDHEQVSGNLIGHYTARCFNLQLINLATDIIGFTEMRTALELPPPGPWTKYREPSADELASTSTIEEYFDILERREERSLDNGYFFEKNIPPVIAFLDKRFPAIRAIFKRKFQELLRENLEKKVDKETVDHLIDEYSDNTLPKVKNAIELMYREKMECVRRSRKLLQG